MRPHFKILEAMLYCPHKAWRVSKEDPHEITDFSEISNPLAMTAWGIINSSGQNEPTKPSKQYKQAQELLADTEILITKSDAPPFYKIPHCSECQFKNECYQKLIERGRSPF